MNVQDGMIHDTHKIAVVCLTRGYIDRHKYDLLIARNMSIEKKLALYYPRASYIIVHEGDVSTHDQIYIREHTPSLNLVFIEFAFNESNTIMTDSRYRCFQCEENYLTTRFSNGYRHMCHFWFIDFIELFSDFDFLLRIDEDCIVKWFDHSIFNRVCYPIHTVSIQRRMDHQLVVQGLEKFCRYFNEISGKQMRDIVFETIPCPYTNVMIINLKNIVKYELLSAFQKMVHDSAAIYTNRWGDLPLWGAYASLIHDSDEPFIMQDKFMRYYHQSHDKIIR